MKFTKFERQWAEELRNIILTWWTNSRTQRNVWQTRCKIVSR